MSTEAMPVHPNSTAARKWGRKTWSPTKLFVEAAAADRRGHHQHARSLRAKAMRLRETDFNCG